MENLFSGNTPSYPTVSNIPTGFVGTARVGTDLYVGDGTSLSLQQGAIKSSVWFKFPSIFKVRFTGTGTAIIDAKDALSVISLNVATYVLTNATNQIEYPFLGDTAVYMRATLTGTVTMEII